MKNSKVTISKELKNSMLDYVYLLRASLNKTDLTSVINFQHKHSTNMGFCKFIENKKPEELDNLNHLLEIISTGGIEDYDIKHRSKVFGVLKFKEKYLRMLLRPGDISEKLLRECTNKRIEAFEHLLTKVKGE